MNRLSLLPNAASSELILDAHNHFLMAARQGYASGVKWTAPARQVERIGREEVIRHLLREAGGMYDPEYTLLRRNSNERQIIDEFAIRFVYAGEGIDNAPAEKGDFIELKRVRILDLSANRIVLETCIENWTVLLPEGKR
jgi:hypothetical protein